jgi:hypothetical protein
MPLYMDVHNHVPGLTKDAAAKAHAADLKIQKKHGVDYQKPWFDEKTGKVFCPVKAPSKEAADKCPKEAHGLLADGDVEVQEGH